MEKNKYRVWDTIQKKYRAENEVYLTMNDGPIDLVDPMKVALKGDYLIVEWCINKKDKNGKEIYEGDIVKGQFKMQCVWNNGDASFKLLCPENGYIYSVSSFVDTLEIIGNIHEQ